MKFDLGWVAIIVLLGFLGLIGYYGYQKDISNSILKSEWTQKCESIQGVPIRIDRRWFCFSHTVIEKIPLDTPTD